MPSQTDPNADLIGYSWEEHVQTPREAKYTLTVTGTTPWSHQYVHVERSDGRATTRPVGTIRRHKELRGA